MRALLVAALLLAGCATADTPPDAWVFRPPEGQPSLIEAFERDFRRAPLETAEATGSLVGLVAVIVLRVVGR
jgi:outer membrane biogenesis lipoprotein LolB